MTHTQHVSSGQVIGPSQRPLPNTTLRRQTATTQAGIEPTIQANEQPQANVLDRAVTGTGVSHVLQELLTL